MAATGVLDALQLGDHVCGVFDDAARLNDLAAEYVGDGLDRHHKVLFVIDAITPGALLAELEHRGVPARAALASGQLRIDIARTVYAVGGRFEPAVMMASWHTEIAATRREGWAGLRVCGDMGWASGADPIPGAARLDWYEAQVNRVFADGYAMALCLYDRRLFSPGQLKRLVGAHPAVLPRRTAGIWTPQLRMRYTTDPPGVRLAGEVDLSNRPALATVLDGLLEDVAAGPRVTITIDVSELRFADGAAAHLLARTAVLAPAGLRLTGCTPLLARLVDLFAGYPVSSGGAGTGRGGVEVAS